MTYFTAENTEGFTDVEMAMLNSAHEVLAEAFPSVEEYSIGDMLNNAFNERSTQSELVRIVTDRFSA